MNRWFYGIRPREIGLIGAQPLFGEGLEKCNQRLLVRLAERNTAIRMLGYIRIERRAALDPRAVMLHDFLQRLDTPYGAVCLQGAALYENYRGSKVRPKKSSTMGYRNSIRLSEYGQ